MTRFPPGALAPAPLRRFLELYDAGRFWDSHEALEGAWRSNGSDFYQGLILYASAWVHWERGNAHGVQAQLTKASERLASYPAAYLGMDVSAVREHCAAVRSELTSDPEGWQGRVSAMSLEFVQDRVRGDEVELRDVDEPIAFVRTPEARFRDLPDFPFAPHYAEVPGGLRMHFVDQGPRHGSAVVLLHGEPTWSFLYRRMIPILASHAYRVVAPDLIGFGRSDKPTAREDYTYERQVEWMRCLLFDHLDLSDVTLFAQDWGGLIGLRVVAEDPKRFARVAVANTGLPTGDEPPNEAFMRWRAASQSMPVFATGELLQSATRVILSPEEVAAYDAPFPDSTYQAGARVMPALVPITPDDPASEANRVAWEVLHTWTKPFATFFSDGDPITRPSRERFLSEVPGAQGQSHETVAQAGHFLQEDKGEELADLLMDFIERSGS